MGRSKSASNSGAGVAGCPGVRLDLEGGGLVVLEFRDKEAMAAALGRVSAYSEGNQAKGMLLMLRRRSGGLAVGKLRRSACRRRAPAHLFFMADRSIMCLFVDPSVSSQAQRARVTRFRAAATAGTTSPWPL